MGTNDLLGGRANYGEDGSSAPSFKLYTNLLNMEESESGNTSMSVEFIKATDIGS